MATYTNNYALIKPSAGEPASRVPLNTNFDDIDEIMHDNAVNLRDAEAMIAPAFNTATAYVIGDKVTYNHHLYIFKTAHSAGDWNGNEVDAFEVTGDSIITGTLVAGQTSIAILSDYITTDSVLDFYTSIYGVNPLSVSVVAGEVTLTFNAQATNMTVGVKIVR